MKRPERSAGGFYGYRWDYRERPARPRLRVDAPQPRRDVPGRRNRVRRRRGPVPRVRVGALRPPDPVADGACLVMPFSRRSLGKIARATTAQWEGIADRTPTYLAAYMDCPGSSERS